MRGQPWGNSPFMWRASGRGYGATSLRSCVLMNSSAGYVSA
jgi:hypothetical protein